MRSDPQGGIYAVCYETPPLIAAAPAPPVAAGVVPIAALPAYHSKPGLSKVLYLDFDGEIVASTAWNASEGVTSWDCKAFDTDGDPATLSDAEIAIIQEIWQRVSEDYAPFAIDVTTERPASYTNTTAHAVITPDADKNGVALPGCTVGAPNNPGGIAYVGVYGSSGYATSFSPAWIYSDNLGNSPKYIGEAVSHEVGHNMGLSHDGDSSSNYYLGHGSGAISWAPIMGVGYYSNVVQWSKGEYPDANLTTQDDLAVIAAKTGYTSDVVGNTIATASALTVSGGAINQSGLIETTSDEDLFSFTSGAGTLSLILSAFPQGPNLDIRIDLYNSSNALIGTADTPTALGTSLSQGLAQGTYYVKVSGVGALDLVNGYSDYGSLGQYTITGTVPPLPNTISFSSATYTHTEGDSGTTTATITATRNGGSSGAIGVSYATSNGTATAGSDFTTTSGTLSWANGDAANKTFTVTIAGDTTFESDETISLSLGSPTGGSILGTSSATLTIANDEVGLAFSSTTYTQTEGNSGTVTATITASRTGGTSGAVGVSYATANGTASAGSDYTATSGTLSWANGDAADKTFTVTVAGDATFESNETVLLSLSSPTGGASLGLSSATLTIVNDDAVPTGTLSFSASTYSQVEGNSSFVNVTITATRTGGSGGAVGVSYATANGTASSGSDYNSASGILNWSDGDTANKTFTVRVNGDTTVESDETVLLSLSSPSGGATLGTSNATLTIVNNDASTAGTLAFSAVSYGGAEGDSGTSTVTITATRTGGSTGAVTAAYATANGTASAGTDYTAASGTLSWASGNATAKTFTVTIAGDTTVESNETILLSLSGPTGGAVLGTSSATLRITNDDGGGGSGGGSGGGGGGGGGCGLGIGLACIALALGLLLRPARTRRTDRD